MKRITMDDVAKQAGVSKGTVSAVINRKNSVKPETRKKVLSVMRKLNFRPRGTARNLRRMEQEKSIGLIIRDLSYPFYMSVAIGVREYASSKGYVVFVTSSENNHESEVKFSQLFSTKDIRGAIIAPIIDGNSEIEHLFKLKMLNYPFVLLENVKGIQANVVSIDNLKAMKIAVKYLIESGHKKIVHFAGPETSSHAAERIDGFCSAFSETTLIFKPEMIVDIGSVHANAYQNVMHYFKKLSRDDYPTAIICFNDQQALVVLEVLDQLQLHVPEDISIIGNDDIYFARMYPVPLTTIQAPMKELGRKAAEILIRNIESPTAVTNENIVLDAHFIVRKSTKVLCSNSPKLSESSNGKV
jgi:LacI family transcriptional regulator